MDDRNKANRQAKGESNGFAKLTEKQVLEIRENKNKLKKIELAKLYDVNESTIRRTISKEQWKHI